MTRAGGSINSRNIRRIAERIVANELDFRGFEVSALHEDGLSANADLMAVRDGCVWQIQVVGAAEDRGWWFNYGYVDAEVVERSAPMFNRAAGPPRAEVIALVCAKSPSNYCCAVLPVAEAEKAAQLNLEYTYRRNAHRGAHVGNQRTAPSGPAWVAVDYIWEAANSPLLPLIQQEQEILKRYLNNWKVAFAAI